MRTAALAVLVAACYRDSPPAVQNTALVIEAPLACGTDDRDFIVSDTFPEGRLRMQGSGSLSARNGTAWTPPNAPATVPQDVGPLKLFLYDEVDAGHLAFYREPYDLGSCKAAGATNCAYEAHLYDREGRQVWSLALGALLSRPDHLEIQDIRYASGVLYFNEACASYSREAQRRCSSLVAVDPARATVLWRTPPLISNGRFFVRGCYIVAGYGFTAEPDALHLVDRATGTVLRTLPVSSAPQSYTLGDQDRLAVQLYGGNVRRFKLKAFETRHPQLISLDGPEAMGGATYASP